MSGHQQREEFLKQLAIFLFADQTMRSIKLQAGDPDARKWAELRRTVPIQGYPLVDEAIPLLREFLFGRGG